MPDAPGNPNLAFDQMQVMLQFARTRINDAIQSVGGEVLTDTQPFSQVVVNAAWRRMQGIVASMGFSLLKKDAVIFNLPVVASPPPLPLDPSTQCWMNWTQFFDGANFYDSPTLPLDFISPLRLWERRADLNGSGALKFLEMDLLIADLPSIDHRYRNWVAQWRNNALFLPGATVATDLKMFYSAFLPDFIDMGSGDSGTPWSSALIPIPRAASALAWVVGYEMVLPRGDVDAEVFNTRGTEETMKLADQELQDPRTIKAIAELGKRGDPTSPSASAMVKG